MQETLPPGMDRVNQNNTGPFFQINLCERERLQPIFSDFLKRHEEFESDLCSPFSDFSINAFGNSVLSVQPAAQRVLSHIQFPLRLHPGPLMAAHIIRQRKPSLLLRPPQIGGQIMFCLSPQRVSAGFGIGQWERFILRVSFLVIFDLSRCQSGLLSQGCCRSALLQPVKTDPFDDRLQRRMQPLLIGSIFAANASFHRAAYLHHGSRI